MKKFAAVTAALVVVGVSALAVAPAANAETPTPQAAPVVTSDAAPQGALDPATFEGRLVVAVPSGHEVVVNVKAGEAPAVVKQIQSADAAGKAQKLGQVVAPLAGCGENVRSLAGPFGYATSVQGCAVIGYPGYQREYHWYKESDVSICTHGKGFNSSNAATWYNTGCQDGNWLVPWGNTLAYTQMQGLSLSGATGAAYVWRA